MRLGRYRGVRPRDAHSSRTEANAAERCRTFAGLDRRYVAINAATRGTSCVLLEFEDIERYDADWHETEDVRSVEGVLFSVGWRRADIKYLAHGARRQFSHSIVNSIFR